MYSPQNILHCLTCVITMVYSVKDLKSLNLKLKRFLYTPVQDV